jgi:protoheme IX farnesyltransferase
MKPAATLLQTPMGDASHIASGEVDTLGIASPGVEVTGPAARLGDYIELTRPRISLMVLVTVAAGAIVGGAGLPDGWLLFHALLGTALVAAGASALNQLLERDTDALMERTENRPLPAGRLQPIEVLIFGLILGAGGVAYLALLLPHPLAAAVAAITLVCYAFVYTPLKRRTSLNTLVGAVPGALPPIIGWAAARGSLDLSAAGLFGILFLWQVPHFLAIAWIYRDDYSRAGLRMLPVVDSAGSLTGRQMVVYCFALVPVSLLPVIYGQSGSIYAIGAIVLGGAYLAFAVGFLRERSIERARGVLRVSLIYLPVLLALLLLDGFGR